MSVTAAQLAPQKSFKSGFLLDIVPGAGYYNFFKFTGQVKLYNFQIFNTAQTANADAAITSTMITRDGTVANDLLFSTVNGGMSAFTAGYLKGHFFAYPSGGNSVMGLYAGNEINPDAALNQDLFVGFGYNILSANPAADSFVALKVTANASTTHQTNTYNMYAEWQALSSDGAIIML